MTIRRSFISGGVDLADPYERARFIYDLQRQLDELVAAINDGGGGGGTPSDTVVESSTFGQPSDAGVSEAYSRGDHVHGTPDDPIPAHVAASNPHPLYCLNERQWFLA